jgi:hypothetical protein
MIKAKSHFVVGIAFVLLSSGLSWSNLVTAQVFMSGFEDGESPCLDGLVMDTCGICGGDGSACVCKQFEAVGYVGRGDTCNFFTDGQWPDGEPDLPWAALDEYTYNELFSGEGFELPFDYDGGIFSLPADPENTGMGTVGRAHGCGACLMVTGSEGTDVFMVIEIADIGAVGANGRPRNVHLNENGVLNVRDTFAVGIDVTVQPVPCPLSGSIQLKARMFNYSQPWYWRAVYYTPYNSVYPIKKMEIQAVDEHDQWYDLPKDWTNRYRLENYGGLGVEIPIPDPPNGPVRFRITSLYGEVLVTPPVQQVERPADSEWAFYDMGVQFQPRNYTLGACSPVDLCGNKILDVGESCEAALTAGCNPSTCEFYP